MKNNLKKIALVLVISILSNSCVNESFNDPKDSCVSPGLAKTKEVTALYAQATSGAQSYIVDDIIEGYVVSSDEGGNFYQSMYVQPTDGSRGFNISVGEGNLYLKGFQPGKKVFLKLKGLTYANPSSGARGLIFGATPTSTFTVDRISELEYKKFMVPSCDIISEDAIVTPITLAQVSDTYLNKLVEFDNAEFTADFVGGTFDINRLDASDSNTFITNNIGGATLPVRTSRFSNFAADAVPAGNGKIRGVLTKFGTTHQLILRTTRDLKLTNARVGPLNLVNEPFPGPTLPEDWTTFSVLGAEVWNLVTFAGNSYAQMSGFSNGNNANEDWLITPKFDLSGFATATVAFDTAKSNFSGNPIQVFVSKNYSGSGNPNAPGVIWTQITGFPLATGFTLVNSGNLSLNPFIGNSAVYVGFKYTSTTAASTTWQVDNVKVRATL